MADENVGPRKRPRINRACAACRRRKIKCDGSQPCKACSNNELICSYDDDERRRNGPEYIQTLEKKVEELEALLGHSLSSQGSRSSSRQNSSLSSHELSLSRSPVPQSQAQRNSSEDDVLETMVSTSERPLTWRHTPEERHWGQFAGLSLLQRMRNLCSHMSGLHDASQDSDNTIEDDFVHAFDSASPPEPSFGSWDAFALLPSQEKLVKCIDLATEQSCCLLSFIDRPSLDMTVQRIYDTDALDYTPEDRKLLALLFALLALGKRFEINASEGDKKRLTENLSKGLRYFRASRSMLDVADCHDIVSLQTVLCLIIYLQASSMLSTCYSYICAGVAASLRMGLHSPEVLDDFPVEQRRVRRCIFSVLNIMDTYVTTALGLPRTLRDVEADKIVPLSHTPSAQDTSFLPDDADLSLVATNTHAKLVHIMARAVESNHPVTRPICQKNGFYGVEYHKIVEVENELDAWYNALPQSLSFDTDGGAKVIRSQLLIRLAYAHVQMVLYRPFLHHAAKDLRPYREIRYKAYACGSACVKAAMQVVWLAEALEERGLFNEAHWFVALIVSFAATILMLFVLSNEGDDSIQAEADAAERMKDLLAKHGARSLSAKRSSAFLQELSDAKKSGSRHPYSALSSHTDDPFETPRDARRLQKPEEKRQDITVNPETESDHQHTLQAMSYPRLHPYLDELSSM